MGKKKNKSKLLKQKKRAKRRYRAGGKTERLDMRKGGRVQLLEGGDPLKRDEEQEIPRGTERNVPPVDEGPTGGSFSVGRDASQDNRVPTTTPTTTPTSTTTPPPPPPPVDDRVGRDREDINRSWRNYGITGSPAIPPGFTPPVLPPTDEGGTVEEPAPDVGFTQYLTPEQERRRQERYARTEEDLEKAKRGQLDLPQIPDPRDVVAGPDSTVEQMADLPKVSETKIIQEGEELPTETVVTGTASTSRDPNAIKASTYTADQILEAEVVDAKTGNISKEAIAGMQSQALTKAATGVTIEEEEASKALTDRVVGVLSTGALASEQAVRGLDLPKVLRAKKQLRNAGLSEEQIAEIGNDPDSLEARLMDLTEEERGMIEGLPEEALVSNQLDTLLKGMDEGEIPVWARPAVAAVEGMLAQRGMSASTVGRDALFNAIIQSAIPLAQSNAQAIQQSVSQQKGLEAQAELQNAQMRQQTALTNASNVFNMDMAQFNADQQTALSNSKFLQTVTLTNASNEQQAVIQEAASLAQLDLATLDSRTKLEAQNAKSFLTMDMANLDNKQQSEVLRAQLNQQRMFSNQAALNASQQFNSSSENQTNQFMTNLAQQTRQFNSTQLNAMEQFNTQQQNAAEARRVGNELDIAKADAAMKSQIDQFNAQQNFAREQWNSQNAQAVQQADIKWRRQVNTANTAAYNAINQQNAQNMFGLSSQAQAFLWQELRDQADYAFRSADNYEQRKSAMYIAMLGNESGNYEGGKWTEYMNGAKTLLDGFLGG